MYNYYIKVTPNTDFMQCFVGLYFSFDNKLVSTCGLHQFYAVANNTTHLYRKIYGNLL